MAFGEPAFWITLHRRFYPGKILRRAVWSAPFCPLHLDHWLSRYGRPSFMGE
jgi:hypothetical protein